MDERRKHVSIRDDSNMPKEVKKSRMFSKSTSLVSLREGSIVLTRLLHTKSADLTKEEQDSVLWFCCRRPDSVQDVSFGAHGKGSV